MSKLRPPQPIPGFPDYFASEFGEIVSAKRRNLRTLHPHKDEDGYLRVKVRRRGGVPALEYVHRLVCMAFHGEQPSPSHEVAHANGDKIDNRPSNLRWATRLENMADQRAHGRAPIGARNGRAKLTEQQVAEIRKWYTRGGISQRMLADEYGVSESLVCYIIRGERWRTAESGARWGDDE